MSQQLSPRLRLEIAMHFDPKTPRIARNRVAAHRERHLICKIVATVCTMSLFAVLLTT